MSSRHNDNDEPEYDLVGSDSDLVFEVIDPREAAEKSPKAKAALPVREKKVEDKPDYHPKHPKLVVEEFDEATLQTVEVTHNKYIAFNVSKDIEQFERLRLARLEHDRKRGAV